ncbi:hypothetical protein [Marinobacter sp. SS21]|uniref:hypothetical protein n=1 Tax=Marinobacter sp. SS21 TaxID=2979460 RepID=UPI00232F5D77|nr:hypothetical protein [Marinobacter sp. SS21]MDC0663681.1 hypothetical protein [Marinobacter sp. SS21]
MRKGLISAVRGQFSTAQQRELEAMVRAHYRTHVGDERLVVFWMEFEPDQMFTNYAPSQSAIVTLECANDFPQAKRVAMLTACANDWCAQTGQHPDHLMLALLEQDLFGTFLASNRERLSAAGAIQFYGSAAMRALRVRVTRGVFAFSANR